MPIPKLKFPLTTFNKPLQKLQYFNELLYHGYPTFSVRLPLRNANRPLRKRCLAKSAGAECSVAVRQLLS